MRSPNEDLGDSGNFISADAAFWVPWGGSGLIPADWDGTFSTRTTGVSFGASGCTWGG